MNSIKETGEWLVKHNRHDTTLKSQISEKVDGTQTTYDNFTTKVEIRYNRLQNALLKSQEFQATFDDFLNALGALGTRLKKEEPLDSRFQPLKTQLEEHEVCKVL